MLIFFIISFLLSLILTALIRRAAFGLKIVDTPDGNRKLHTSSVPLLGGVALFLAFWAVTIYLVFNPRYGIGILTDPLLAALVGSAIILLVGIADDIRPFSVSARFALTALAAFITVSLGPLLTKVNNPFGGVVHLSAIVGGAIGFLWLMGMMYTTKILDGLDGLSTGIAAIGSFMIFLFTQTEKYYQPNVGLLALIFTGVLLGFLLFNFYPAKIFLGESGSLFVGFILGTLAIISGAKMAIAALVMAIPIIDLARVMYVRWRRGQSILQGDREHLHFKLVDRGMGQRQAVVLLYAVSGVLGVATLFSQSRGKILLLGAVILVMVLIANKTLNS